MRAVTLLVLAALAAACSSSSGREKGGLVRVQVDEGARARAYPARRFALVVGVGEYGDASWRPLNYAGKDADDVAAALADPARGAFTKVHLLRRRQDTSLASIRASLAVLRREATRADDIVVVYLSTHGTLERDAHGELRRYLVTSDTRLSTLQSTGLGVDALKAELDRLPSRRRLLVLATCHSGSGKSLLPQAVLDELQNTKGGFLTRPLEEVSRASMVLSACDWGETAREDPSLQNDIYTHFLVEGLTGAADRNLDGAVTATEAHDYARRRTYAFTEGRQRPSAEILEVGADPLVLSGALTRQGQPELYSYNPRMDGVTLKVDGEVRTELPGGAAVRAGSHRVELEKGGTAWVAQTVVLAEGERLELETLVQPPRRRHALALIGGMSGFLESPGNAAVAAWSPVAGAAFRWEDVPLAKVALGVDLRAYRAPQQLRLGSGASVPFRYTSVTLGVSLPYLWRRERWTLLAGPRVAALWLERSFQLEAYRQAQRTLTVAPGLTGGVTWQVTDAFELLLQTELMLTYVSVDGAAQARGFVGGWAGVGWRL